MKNNYNFNRIVEMNTEVERRRIAAIPMQASVRHLLRADGLIAKKYDNAPSRISSRDLVM